ncbi:hypothetical protein PG994_002547 [Apiospora phragmitis]|uniref:Uncharacterized protein n=1 Tax=Apiospora phragmitis TaxID=2905665 RepID=A0ABR1W895_9PEZI
MNRFRTKKKGKEEVAAPRPSQDSESSGFRFRKGKKQQEDPKPEIDLASALPSSDDFRTSLLMTGLSARFSMLREQDDPSTKIGKALDDSVLFPKRQSRMQDFGPAGALSALGGLSDIAEVESIRAPFARNDPYASDNDSTHGSVMTRAKPTEGNNLFGGRQKVYKIAAGGGGMNGRVLYDDDVALSAFQKWKRDEQKRKSLEGSTDDGDDGSRRPSVEEPYPRSESPFSTSYNRKRETNSTTSSIPSMARNSTAATSITSQQPTPSVKDWQGGSTAPTSASSTPVLERSFTRGRRLYETGLNHDLQEQQTSALSRMDTLSRQRNLGSRTPDLAQASPSPTTTGFSDRFFGDRRILSKASAPQLRSMSPTTSRSGAGTPDLGIRVPSGSDSRNGSFAGAPPLSPPISESEEIAALPIGPNDRGKATALGVFQKPAQPYDESRFAQRQLQLQQGRDTPTQRFRTESNASHGSASSTPQQLEIKTESSLPKISPTLAEEPSGSTFFDDSDVSPGRGSQLHIERPADNVHPAFRQGALPTPLSLSGRSDGELSPNTEPSSLSPQPQLTPADSPTLGPGAIAGLSGMVRQHLRADSGASSIYGIASATENNDRRYVNDVNDYRDLVNNTMSWNPQHDSTAPGFNMDSDKLLPEFQGKPAASRESRGADDFARELADGARRVREKLTSYVESDNGSTTNLIIQDNREPLNAQQPKSAPFGLLRNKSSLGSISQPSRAGKMQGVGAPTSPGSANQQSYDDMAGLPSMREDVAKEAMADPSGGNESEGNSEQHAGIRAFRQARRELQRLKEAEMQQRRQPPQGSLPEPPSGRATPTNQWNPTHRPSEDSMVNISRSGSRGTLTLEHDRSGSDSSRERPGSRPTRSRNGSSPPGRLLESNDDFRQPMRSPGLPGTNIRRSPHMPPQGLAGNSPARVQQGQQSLRVRPVQDSELGNPSPISPMAGSFIPSSGLPSSPRAFKTPNPGLNSDGTEVPGLNDNMKRSVKKREISEPTFVMSTSRVPTVSLPAEASANRERVNSRSRSNSKSDNHAPPLPPINPRRRQDGSKTRTIFGSLVGRKSDEANASAPQLSTGPAPGSSHSADDDVADKPVTRQLRKMASEAQGMQLNRPMGAPNSNGQFASIGPPASRMVVTQNAKDRERTSSVLPGGMI